MKAESPMASPTQPADAVQLPGQANLASASAEEGSFGSEPAGEVPEEDKSRAPHGEPSRGSQTRLSQSKQRVSFAADTFVPDIDGPMSECDQSSLGQEDEMSREQLQTIKAKTMYEMTEDIIDEESGLRKRLLFLTNSQADLIASSDASMQKMLDALDIPKPKLVINLLGSQGFSDYCTACFTSWDGVGPEDAGLIPKHGAFVDADDENNAISKLDHFMASVILPLAAKTQAIILCQAMNSLCVLSASLTRMLSVHRSTWGKELPFTILSCTGSPGFLYQNPDTLAVWRAVRRGSKTWRSRDRKILELVWARYQNRVPALGIDLDANAMIYLIVDTINAKKERIFERGPFNRLMNELVRYLSSTLPALSVKTGHADKPVLEQSSRHASSLGVAMEAMLSGSPLLFIDTRKRESIVGATDRQALISMAQKKYEEHCDNLLKHGTAETMDAMSIAYFHNVLFGDGHIYSNGRDRKQAPTRKVPLHEMITRAEKGSNSAQGGTMDPASVDQTAEVANWLAKRFFTDGWAVMPDEMKEGKDFEEYLGRNVAALTIHIKTILLGRNFHNINVNNPDGAKQQVSELVKLDRLPNETSLQGLLLLRSAWCEFDVAMYLGTWYKRVSKCLFILQLVLAWLAVFVAVVKGSNQADGVLSVPSIGASALTDILFGLAVGVTVVAAIDSYINPKMKWRQLRSCACSLEASIWCYRARVGRYQQSVSNTARPEHEFCDAIINWREELVSAADLQSTNLNAAASVYKHCQYEGSVTDDDHQSPVKPDIYIQLRLQNMIQFYQQRLPVYTRLRFWLKLVLLSLTTLSSILAYLDLSYVVVLATALTGAVVSWTEFSDMARKTERYTRAVRALKKLQLWWDVLTDVEKAGTENISLLIETCEDIIADERLAWQSTAHRLGSAKRASGDEGAAETSRDAPV